MHLKILLVVIIVGAVVHQYPGVVDETKDLIGISGTACGATAGYLTALADDDLSTASQYKFVGETVPAWTDNLDSVDSVDCGCTQDISDTLVRELTSVPNAVSNITEGRIVTFTIEGVYSGEEATLEGGAIVFQPATPGWFVTQEGIYKKNGESIGTVNVGQLVQRCKQ